MKKIESLNNAQKTVLQLEKEINAIGNNLSKVKHKDHNTMKKIINNINYLLTKDEYKNKNYKNETNEEKGENEELEGKKINQNYQNIQNNDRNIDYLLILNKQRSNNNKEKSSNKPYFNRKCFSTSKINSNISVEKKFLNNCNTNRNLKINENLNRNKIINFSNNIMDKNNMTYYKPRLLTEYSKRNSNNNISYKNNTFNKNGGGNRHSIKNIKYLTLNEKVNNSYKNKRNKKSSILDSLYYNYKDNTENNNFFKNNYLKENIKNQTAFSFDQPEMNNSEKVKDLKGFFNEKKERKNLKLNKSKQFQSTAKKNKKIISEKNMEEGQNINFNPNNNNFYNNSTIKYNVNEIYNKSNMDFPFLNPKDEDLSKSSITEKKIRREKNNYIFPYEHLIVNNNNNNIEKNYNNCDIYKTQKIIKDYNYNNYSSKILNSNNMNNNNDKEKINFLLNMLNVNDINEGIIKVNNLLKYEKDINKLKELYKNAYHEKYNFDKNEIWLSKIINNYKRNERYKNFCQNIMIIYKIKNFEEFKKFTKRLLAKTKNKDCKEYSNGKNKINFDENYSNSKYKKADILKKNKNTKENEKDIDSNNSEDINFTNIQNFKIITDYIN